MKQPTDSETYTDLNIRRELAMQEGHPEVAAQLVIKMAEIERLVREGRGDGTLVLDKPGDDKPAPATHTVTVPARPRIVPGGQLQLLAALDHAGELESTLVDLDHWYLCELLALAMSDYRASR